MGGIVIKGFNSGELSEGLFTDTARDNDILLPLYYIHNAELDEADIALAEGSWKLIAHGTSIPYQSIDKYKHPSAMIWFHHEFYGHLFEILPSAQHQFHCDMDCQGMALAHLIDDIVGMLRNMSLFEERMKKLAVDHAQRGVVCCQYGIVGEVLLWTFNRCLGTDFDAETNVVWVKIYSLMLRIILPAGDAEEKRIRLEHVPGSHKNALGCPHMGSPTLGSSSSSSAHPTISPRIVRNDSAGGSCHSSARSRHNSSDSENAPKEFLGSGGSHAQHLIVRDFDDDEPHVHTCSFMKHIN